MAEARALAQSRLNGQLADYLVQINQQAEADDVAAAAMQNGAYAAAVARDENRALVEALKYGKAGSEEYFNAVTKLSASFEQLRLSQQGLRDASAIRSQQDQLALLLRESELVWTTARGRAEEVAALRERQAIIGEGGDPSAASARDRIANARELAGLKYDAGQLGDGFESAFGRATSKLEDAIAAGGDFRDVIKGIEGDLARLITRMAITQPLEKAASQLFGSVLSSLFGGSSYSLSYAGGTQTGVSTSSLASTGMVVGGFANGGIMSAYGEMPLRRYDAGGIATSPQLALFAEGRKPEAYVPLQDGRTIPVTVQGSGGGVVYSPTIHVDARGADAGVEQRLYVRMQQMIDANHRKFVSDMQRGGAMSRAVGRRGA